MAGNRRNQRSFSNLRRPIGGVVLATSGKRLQTARLQIGLQSRAEGVVELHALLGGQDRYINPSALVQAYARDAVLVVRTPETE
jgi:hypothetical protein